MLRNHMKIVSRTKTKALKKIVGKGVLQNDYRTVPYGFAQAEDGFISDSDEEDSLYVKRVRLY